MSAPADVRVLVVDDSSVVRRLVSTAVDTTAGLCVAGSAGDGAEAVTQVAACSPDVVVLDVEMPVLDGLGALRRIKARWPELPCVMYSTLTGPGTGVTMQALAAGAEDFACKPTAATSGVTWALQAIRIDLVPKLLALGERYQARKVFAAPRAAVPTATFEGALRPSAVDVDAVVIATSTGGPAALTAVAPDLPASLPVPILIAQHMPATFTGLFAGHLGRVAPFPVVEVTEPVALEAGTAYVATGGRHMVVKRRAAGVWAELNDDPPEQSCRPSADVLFRSAALTYRSRVLGVVLTGMGRDGLDGCQRLAGVGAPIVVQDEETSAVWGMPGAVAKAGLAGAVLPLDRVAPWLTAALHSKVGVS